MHLVPAPPDKAVLKSVDEGKENGAEEQCSGIGSYRWGNV